MDNETERLQDTRKRQANESTQQLPTWLLTSELNLNALGFG